MVFGERICGAVLGHWLETKGFAMEVRDLEDEMRLLKRCGMGSSEMKRSCPERNRVRLGRKL